MSISLKARDGLTGQINASRSGKVYQIAENGRVDIDPADLLDLLNAGFTYWQKPALVAPVFTTAAIEAAVAAASASISNSAASKAANPTVEATIATTAPVESVAAAQTQESPVAAAAPTDAITPATADPAPTAIATEVAAPGPEAQPASAGATLVGGQ